MKSTISESKSAQLCTPAIKRKLTAARWILIVVSMCQPFLPTPASAVIRHSLQTRHQSHDYSTRSHEGQHSRKRIHSATKNSGSERTLAHGRRGRHHFVVASKSEKHHAKAERHAYPIDFFLAKPPPFDTSPLQGEQSADIRAEFYRGTADSYSPRTLVKAGIVGYHPIRGGIFWRREPIKYIVVHSTEPGVTQSAERIIESWSSMGRRHPGAQYVVDRDGTILQALDPDLGTVHVNIFKTLPGINNDDSVGIEMCHTGKQDYPQAQVDSVTRLVVYLQNRYRVQDANIVTHRYAQQGDHTDPVNFDFPGFLATKNILKNQGLVLKYRDLAREALTWVPADLTPPPENFLQIHRQLGTRKDDKTVIEMTPPVEATIPVKIPLPGMEPFKQPTIMPLEPVKQPLPAVPSKQATVPPAPPTPQPTLLPTQPIKQPTLLPAEPPKQSTLLPAEPIRIQTSATPAKPALPSLRGPIEMAPGEATILNRPYGAPTPGLNTAPLPPMK